MAKKIITHTVQLCAEDGVAPTWKFILTHNPRGKDVGALCMDRNPRLQEWLGAAGHRHDPG